jgi:hypothetical protein
MARLQFLLFPERNQLMGEGLGLIDIHLMASALLSGIPLWSLDNQLRRECSRLRIACCME